MVFDSVNSNLQVYDSTLLMRGTWCECLMIKLFLYIHVAVTFGFIQASYTFPESIGTASVVLVIEGQSSFDIPYNISAMIVGTDTAEGMLCSE